MEFCPACRVTMDKGFAHEGKVQYFCPKCGLLKPGKPSDTMIYESADLVDEMKYGVTIERMSHDLAAKTVPFECPACGRLYVSMIRYGQSASIAYACECGAIYSSSDIVQKK